MKCERCKIEEANIHLKQILGEKIISLNLCSACAGEVGLSADQGNSFNALAAIEMLAEKLGLGGLTHLSQVPKADADLADHLCPECGLTGEEFARTGLLGCPVCYEAFAARLEKDFSRLHRGSVHCGRAVDAGNDSPASAHIELSRLKDELARAVAVEDYEGAAEIRDRIAALEGTRKALT